MDVFVTNKNGFYHEDMFDSVTYAFPSGEKVLVPEVAAAHMLGFGRQDKTETLVRLGWANTRKDKEGVEEGVRKLANFVFSKAKVVEEVISPGEAQAA